MSDNARPNGDAADELAPTRAGDPPKAATAPNTREAPPSGPDAWDRMAAWLVAHGPLPALAAITITVAVIHARIFTGETAGDDLSFHFAEAARLVDCIAHGDFDFWNPSANGGFASLYYYQSIPQLASAIPAALFGHHLFWFQLSVVLPLVLAPAAAYKGMRLLDATPWQAVLAAFCVAFMNGQSRWGAGSAGTFEVGLYTQTWALCAFPLALGYAARWMTHATNLATATVWSGFVLLCHPFAGFTLGLAVLVAWLANLALVVVDRLLARAARALERRSTGHGPVLGRVAGALAERWRSPPQRVILAELWRGAILAVLLALTFAPIVLPLVIDSEGFGGFPHRVSDEVGPGFGTLATWYASGSLLDWMPKGNGLRLHVLTWVLPAIVVFARARFYRWLWTPALVYALLLGLGPQLGKVGDDLFPPVRTLGAMQTVLAMGIGAGVMVIGGHLWRYAEALPRYAYTLRTLMAAAAAAALVLVAVPGTRALAARVRVLPASQRAELLELSDKLAALPQGRKLPGPGAENHWWNLLPYAYARIPTTLQMGGGGLQASPNYDFLWSQRNLVRTAWVFDAPYLVFQKSRGKNMPIGETVAETKNYEVRKLPSPGLVSPVHIVGVLPPGYSHDEAGHKAAIAWIKGPQPLKDEVLAYAGYGEVGPPPKGRMLRAWRQDSPGSEPDIVAELEVEAPTTFVVRESWHPRWRAYLDGKPVKILRVTPDFPAVLVPTGPHVLELRFERPWWAHAAWLCWPGAALGAWLATRRRRRTSTSITPPVPQR